jgi:hypothetical protein
LWNVELDIDARSITWTPPMDDIGNADRVALMQRLMQLKLEHRDLDGAVGKLSVDPTHDQLQLTRLKRRKLLLKDYIARLEREIDPDVRA